MIGAIAFTYIYLLVGVAFHGASAGRRMAQGGWKPRDMGTFRYVVDRTGIGVTMLFWPWVLAHALMSDNAAREWRERHS